MKTADLDSAPASGSEVLRRRWLAAEARWLAPVEAGTLRLVTTWLAYALDRAQLGLALGEREAAARALADTGALAIAAAACVRLDAGQVTVEREGAPDLIFAPPVEPRPRLWCEALCAAALIADTRPWQALAAAPLIERLVADTERQLASIDAWRLAFGRCLIALKEDDGAKGELALRASRAALSEDEQALAGVLAQLARGEALDSERIDAAVQAKYGESARDEKTSAANAAAFPFDWAALTALAWQRGRLPVLPGWAMMPVAEPLPAARATLPGGALHDAAEAHWYLDLHGAPRTARAHRLLTDSAGRLQAQYSVEPGEGLPQIEASFELVDDAHPPTRPFALDPGELMAASDTLADRVGARPVGPTQALRKQRVDLEQALRAVDAVIARASPGDVAIPESAFVSPRGRAVFAREPARFRLDRLRALRDSYARILAEFDALLADPKAAAVSQPPGAAARANALAAIEILKVQLEPLLRSLALDRSGEIARRLQPKEEDYARVFISPEIAAAARDAYAKLWQAPDIRYADPRQTRIEIDIAPAGMLADDNELSRRFPAGYRGIAHLLNPHRVWVRWKFLRRGESAGMSYDGLVWLDDHWAWFPKPYRVLAHLVSG